MLSLLAGKPQRDKLGDNIAGIVTLEQFAAAADKADLKNANGISEQSTSENMTSAQFKEFSRAMAYTSYLMKEGLMRDLPPPGTVRDRDFADAVKREILRSKDSYLSAGERYAAAAAVAQLFQEKRADARNQLQKPLTAAVDAARMGSVAAAGAIESAASGAVAAYDGLGKAARGAVNAIAQIGINAKELGINALSTRFTDSWVISARTQASIALNTALLGFQAHTNAKIKQLDAQDRRKRNSNPVPEPKRSTSQPTKNSLPYDALLNPGGSKPPTVAATGGSSPWGTFSDPGPPRQTRTRPGGGNSNAYGIPQTQRWTEDILAGNTNPHVVPNSPNLNPSYGASQTGGLGPLLPSIQLMDDPRMNIFNSGRPSFVSPAGTAPTPMYGRPVDPLNPWMGPKPDISSGVVNPYPSSPDLISNSGSQFWYTVVGGSPNFDLLPGSGGSFESSGPSHLSGIGLSSHRKKQRQLNKLMRQLEKNKTNGISRVQVLGTGDWFTLRRAIFEDVISQAYLSEAERNLRELADMERITQDELSRRGESISNPTGSEIGHYSGRKMLAFMMAPSATKTMIKKILGARGNDIARGYINIDGQMYRAKLPN